MDLGDLGRVGVLYVAVFSNVVTDTAGVDSMGLMVIKGRHSLLIVTKTGTTILIWALPLLACSRTRCRSKDIRLVVYIISNVGSGQDLDGDCRCREELVDPCR